MRVMPAQRHAVLLTNGNLVLWRIIELNEGGEGVRWTKRLRGQSGEVERVTMVSRFAKTRYEKKGVRNH